MTGSEKNTDGFIADGYQRAREANGPSIRIAVEKELAERLQAASAEELPALQQAIEQEIQLRLKQVAPRWVLY